MNLTLRELTNLVAEKYFKRGKRYFQDGLVELKSIKAHRIESDILGSELYTVSIVKGTAHIISSCTCIAFKDYGPCKHVAATGLALIAHNTTGYKPSQEFYDGIRALKAIEQYLSKQTKSELVTLILSLTKDYPDLKYDLEFLAGAHDE